MINRTATGRATIPWTKLAGFVAIPCVSAITPVLVLPSLTKQLGAAGWGSLAIGQSLGVFAMTLTASGWGIVGPPLYAATEEVKRPELYRASVTSRILMFIPVSSIAGIVAWLLSGDIYRNAAAFMVPAVAVWSLGGNWYFTAEGRPLRVAAFDTMPRLAASILTVIMLSLQPNGLIYPFTLFSVGLVAVFMSAYVCSHGAKGVYLQSALNHLRRHAGLSASQLATTTFTSLTVPMVALVAPSSVPAFAAVDRLRMFASSGLAAVSNAFQGWIYQRGRPLRERQKVAVVVTVSAGFIAGLGLVTAGDMVQSHLYSNVAKLSCYNLFFQGMAIVLIALGASMTFHLLAPWGRTRAVASAALLGCICGVPAILGLASQFGADGAAAGVMIGELAVAGTLIRAATRHWGDKVRK